MYVCILYELNNRIQALPNEHSYNSHCRIGIRRPCIRPGCAVRLRAFVVLREIQDRRSTLRYIVGEHLILASGDVSMSNDSDEWQWRRGEGEEEVGECTAERASERASRLAPTAVSIVKSRKVREARRVIRVRDRERDRKREGRRGRENETTGKDNRPGKIQKAGRSARVYA